MSKQNAPELRMDGFEGEWDSSEFGDIASRSTLFSDTPQLPRVEYEDIHSGLGILNKDLRAKQSTKVGIYFQPGDVLYGKLRPYLKNWLLSDFEGIAVGDFWVLRSRAAAPHFIYTLIQTNRFSEAASISSGSKMPRADWTLVSQTQLPAPPTVEEQQAIGAVFTKLDATITSHRKKLDLLKQTKTSLLQRLFPQDGATVPELRLDGFEGEWTEKTLGDTAAEFQSGDFLRADDITQHGSYPVYGGNGLRGYTDKYNHSGLYTLIGRQGALCGNINISDGKAYFTEHAIAVKANRNHDTLFLSYLFGILNLGQYSAQSAQPGLAVGTIKEVKTLVPTTVEEQRAIGAVFSRLDTLISAEAQYIDKLTQTKTALLQKMFA